VSPDRPEQDDFLEDEEQEEYGQRSIFATGWFRAVLVLLVLAVIAVIAVPLIGGWFEPTPPPKVTTKAPEPPKPVEPPPAVAPAPSTPSPPVTSAPSTSPALPTTAQMPSNSSTPTTPPAGVTSAPTTPPAATTPAPETPAPSSKPAEKAKTPERTASTATGSKSTSKAAAGGSYWVQVGAFKESKNADGLARKLRSEGFSVQVATVNRDQTLHVVRVGGFPDRSKASAAREELQGKGLTGFVTQGPAK